MTGTYRLAQGLLKSLVRGTYSAMLWQHLMAKPHLGPAVMDASQKLVTQR